MMAFLWMYLSRIALQSNVNNLSLASFQNLMQNNFILQKN